MQSEDLARFGLSHESIIEYCNMYEKDDRWIAFMQMQIQKADDLYSYALTGVRYLPKVARKAIYLSAKLYQEILRKIERLDYDVFSSSAKTTKFDKSKVLMTQARYILLK